MTIPSSPPKQYHPYFNHHRPSTFLSKTPPTTTTNSMNTINSSSGSTTTNSCSSGSGNARLLKKALSSAVVSKPCKILLEEEAAEAKAEEAETLSESTKKKPSHIKTIVTKSTTTSNNVFATKTTITTATTTRKIHHKENGCTCRSEYKCVVLPDSYYIKKSSKLVEPTIENVYDRIRFVSEQNCLLIDFSNLHISKIEHVNNIRKCIEELLTSHKAKDIHCLVNYDYFLVDSDELMQKYTEDVVLYLTDKYYKTVQRYTTTPSVQDVSVENFARVLKTANMRLDLCVEIIKDRYVIEGCIGEGSFGKVKLAYDRVTGKKVAIKEMDMNRVRKMGIEQFVKRELKIMKQLSEASDAHVNIVRLYDIIEEGDQVKIVLEYCKGGSLENTFDEHEQFSEQKAHKYFCQIINALEYLHDRYHIMHRDLQLANICRTDNDVIKIVDFGMADYFSPTEYKHTLFAGNVNYSPPEMLLEKRYKGPEIDLWAAGCILYKMLTGYLPFRNAQRTLIGQFTIPLEEEEELSEEVKDLIRNMLNPDPQKRLTIKQIKTHPWWIKYSS